MNTSKYFITGLDATHHWGTKALLSLSEETKIGVKFIWITATNIKILTLSLTKTTNKKGVKVEVEPGKEVLESKVSFKWKKAFFYLFFLILGVLLLIQRGTSFWISKEIERSLSNDYSGYQINLKGIDSSLFSARVELMVKPTLSFRDVTLEEFETTAFVEFKTYRFLYDLYQNKRVDGKKVILLGSGYLRTRSDGLGNIGIEVFGRGRAKVYINWGRQVNFDSGSNLTKVIGPSKLNLEVSDQYVDSSYFAEYFSVYYPGGIIKANNFLYDIKETVPLIEISEVKLIENNAGILFKSVEQEETSAEASIKVDGISLNSLLLAANLLDVQSGISENDFAKAKIQLKLQSLLQEIAKDTINIESLITLKNKGDTLSYTIDLFKRPLNNINNYQDLLRNIKGSIKKKSSVVRSDHLEKIEERISEFALNLDRVQLREVAHNW